MWRESVSLTKAVEDVGQHSYTQTQALKEKEKTLSRLQVHVYSLLIFFLETLSNVEKKAETAEQELRSKVVENLKLEGEVHHLEQRTKGLHDNCASLRWGITKLQMSVSEEEEDARKALAGFDAYREKMEAHRAAVVRAASQTEAHQQLEEKRTLIRMLTQQKEELREDLEKADGNTVLMAKIHYRRYEAIVKRLHCQLSRAQAVHRQTSEDIHHMETQLAELRKQLESSQ
ncbi:Coiled-coil domain-containing protein 122 [Collichthys lucidus]|uniref:Coiled-coil domain-containing protein 122 n=1 Tax=Collichthys lucidus TaxID=240159 RepID=A0A4U5TZT2_COLLU|nr:Coiled-coil domain-containing protein 122 [Collichthys lucidus]